MNRLDQLNTMLKDDPEDNFLLFALAMEYKGAEDFEMAIETFDKLKSVNEDYVGLYYHLGACHAELDEDQQALEIYKYGIRIAEKLGDQHAKSELMNVKVNLEMGL